MADGIDNYSRTSLTIDNLDNSNPYLFDTRYGLAKLINLNYSETAIKKIKGIYYINHAIPANYIKKILKEDKHALIIFEPQSYY